MNGKKAQTAREPYVALFIETSREFGREVLHGIRDYENGLERHWHFFLNPGGMMQGGNGSMGAWPCTGIIARAFSANEVGNLLKLRLPLVMLDPFTGHLRPGHDAVPVISTDTRAIVSMAYDHLRGCGCRSFAYVHSVTPNVWSDARGSAFRARVEAEGFPCPVFPPFAHEPTWEQNMRALGNWIRKLPRHTGIFVCMDQRARDVIEACRETGLLVPEDFAVLGVDNDALLCELCNPRLSSIGLDAFGAGRKAARILDLLMSGRRFPRDAQFWVGPTHISRRSSTAIGFDQDPLVSEARRYLYRRFANPTFQIPDVAEACSASRRLLEMRFNRATGQTLLQALTSIRMEHAQTLLLDTTDAVAKIAAACGFSSENYFIKAFRHHVGLPPSEYRTRAQSRHGR